MKLLAYLTLNDLLVDFAGGNVVVTSQANVKETLVIAKVEINLATILKDKDLAYNHQNQYQHIRIP